MMTEMMKDAAGLGRGGRMSRQRKREAVLRRKHLSSHADFERRA